MSRGAAPDVVVRPARADECERLTDLCVRSKGHWGYDADFLARCRAGELLVTPDTLAAGPTLVLERAGVPLGVAALAGGAPVADLALLFVEPAAMGAGHGRRLLREIAGVARAIGCRMLVIVSDPNAEPFYLRMGAVRHGAVPSALVPGRVLPRLVLDLDAFR